LSNIYLDRLDKHIETNLLPDHNRGRRRRTYRPYMRLHRTITELEKRGEIEEAKRLRQQLQQMPSRDPQDPGYRRLRYIRYADDWLLGFTGPKREAEQIKNEIGQFLHDQLHLELSPTKTLITHGRTQSARFLGYEIVVLDNGSKHDHRGHRSINAQIGLKVPADVIRAKCAPTCIMADRSDGPNARSTATSPSSPSTRPSSVASPATTSWRSTCIASTG
jgi:hypothetical protein